MTNIINYWFNHCGSASSATLSEDGRFPSDNFGLNIPGSWGVYFGAHSESPRLSSFFFLWGFDSGQSPFGILNIKHCRLSHFRSQGTLFGKVFVGGWSQSPHVSQTIFYLSQPFVCDLIRALQSPCEMGKAGFWAHFIRRTLRWEAAEHLRTLTKWHYEWTP